MHPRVLNLKRRIVDAVVFVTGTRLRWPAFLCVCQCLHFPGSREAPYELNADNRFAELENPFEEGVRLFEEGQIADAALCFEAEIARNPENSQVWVAACQACGRSKNTTVRGLFHFLFLLPGAP